MNEAFVRRHFPDVDPIGQRFGPGPADQIVGPTFEIVGVVSDAKYRSLREPMMPTVYRAALELDAFVLHVQTRGTPSAIIESVRQALSALDPGLPLVEVSTRAEDVSANTAGERLTATLASMFGLLAALVTAVGLYGLLAAVVAQRRREIGIRMALGARGIDVGMLVGQQAAGMVTLGTLIGLGATAISARSLQSLLYIAPSDATSFAAATLSVALVAVFATMIPVARAAHVEPADALRQGT